MINGKDIFQDDRKVSLIFHPTIPPQQKLFKDKRGFVVKNNDNTVTGGYLYLTRKSKKILKKSKKRFNKNIELNNFIPRSGLSYDRPPWTMSAYKEAIRRGYKIVDADILFTKDKIPVIAHDIELNRVSNGRGNLTNKTIEELEQLDFGIKFNKKYSGEKILKFEDLLKLCKENEIIIDLDLGHLNYSEFNNNMYEYIRILINYVEKYDMVNSILFNDKRQTIFEIIELIRNDLSFSINGMNEKESIKKIKDKYQNSSIIIYNMGGLMEGKKINEDAVKYGLSLGKKIKAAKINSFDFARKVISWGVNFICTFKLEPFLMNNEKEEPIKVKCISSQFDQNISICEIDKKISLIDNEEYYIYYSTNIYLISEEIVEEPIGEFKYIDTNFLAKLYYKINYFDFKNGIIRLTTSNVIEKNDVLTGVIGPAYDNVAECYQYKYICKGNGSHNIDCIIDINEQDKVKFKGKYNIYSLDGYSLNEFELNKILNSLRNQKEFINSNGYILIMVFIIISILFIKNIRVNIISNEGK